MSDALDRFGAVEFAIKCSGFDGDQSTLYDDQKDRLMRMGVAKAIASLAHTCAHQYGADFNEMIDEGRAVFEK